MYIKITFYRRSMQLHAHLENVTHFALSGLVGKLIMHKKNKNFVPG